MRREFQLSFIPAVIINFNFFRYLVIFNFFGYQSLSTKFSGKDRISQAIIYFLYLADLGLNIMASKK